MNKRPTADDAMMEAGNQIPTWAHILRASHQVEEKLDMAMAIHGLSLSKFGVLKVLIEAEEPLALTELARRLACVKSNVTQLVDRLEADGLVERRDDPGDRRSIRAAITREGRTRFELGGRALVEAENDLFKSLKKEEIRLLTGFLGKLGE